MQVMKMEKEFSVNDRRHSPGTVSYHCAKVINTQDYQLVKVVDKKYMRPSVIIARTITLWGEMNSAVSAIKSGFLMSIGSTLNYGIFDY